MLSLIRALAFTPLLVKALDGPQSNPTTSRTWEESSVQADAFIARLNLTEKVTLLMGHQTGPCVGNIQSLPSQNFSGLCLQDGPLSDRSTDLASVFPAGLTAAATWDKDLIYQRALALGYEFRGKGSHVFLGPVAGPLGRHPLGGRNWEGFSTDPYLTGVAMAASVRGVQEAGVQACAKHFIGNEQETARTTISSNIDDRTMHELYLWPFADAVKANVASIMCSYNRLNQTYTCEHPELLNGLLKQELGFKGYVVTDWAAKHVTVRSIEAGLDMTMPGGDLSDLNVPSTNTGTSFGQDLLRAVQNGTIAETKVDEMARRVLAPYFYLGQNEDFPSVDPSNAYVLGTINARLQAAISEYGPDIPLARDVRDDHAKLIREIGAAGTVLLKNTNNTLPLSQPANIGVFGNDAADVSEGLYQSNSGEFGADIGTLSVGGGSGTGKLTYVISPLSAIRARAQETGARVQYLLDNEVIASENLRSIFPPPDVCLVFLKTFASEAVDRRFFENDWNSTVVVETVAQNCPNTVVVTHSAGVNTMPWAHNPNVTAILAAHFPGQESGNSIVDVLFGDVNPSGRLPYTIPESEEDYDLPTVNITADTQETDLSAWQADFTEGLLIDYRHFDSKNITPLYEFGYGLSYTTFSFSAPLEVTSKASGLSAFPSSSRNSSSNVSSGGNPDLWKEVLVLHTSVSNDGDVAGAQAVQLYVALPEDTAPPNTPMRALRGFEKVTLEPGESKDVEFVLLRRDLSFWDVAAQDWQIPQGEFTFSAGFSSRDLKESFLDHIL
ncbi:glycoside hydrolase family 3 protein [Aplosporella prunicola CBS 121167]|uniref:Probable beta-glucosidase G n=1 Tax=Aplosporella prunicola CBS 121167 TaxID=1176127 RepID=A0A6A6BC19_9PEZI|nr:glycoside hydrolase family 3 protein [Aplosporella prunicola CBS 121167]KAF2141158.1 glycoside hydrolase family 3 protein [Aplosporella prunicola CBS 121167]